MGVGVCVAGCEADRSGECDLRVFNVRPPTPVFPCAHRPAVPCAGSLLTEHPLALPSCSFFSCDRSNGLCNCNDGDQRCEVIKGFFEHSHEGCGAASGTSTCVHPDLVGYQSCEFARRISECRVSVCWAWTVSVMATCGEFFTDMQSSPLSVCNASLAGPNTGAYTLAVYQQQRSAAEEGREVDAPACTASHGQCTEHCATHFNLLWHDAECSRWLQDYVRMPVARSEGRFAEAR